jgi:hypothetical protein
MSPNRTAGTPDSDAEVMASHDEHSDEFVIADIAREDAWVSMRSRDAPVLADWA